MSEEKKEKNDFLSGHEALLNSISKKPDTPEEEPEVQEEEPAAEAPAPEEEVSQEEGAPETEEAQSEAAEESEAVIEEEPEAVVEEEPEVEPEPEPEAEPEPEPETEPEPEAAAEEEEEEVVDQKVEAEIPPVVTETPAKPAPKKKKPANHAEAVKQRHNAVEQAEVKEVLKFFSKYLKPAAAVIAVACILIIASSVIRTGRSKKEAAADQALVQAKTSADYQAILDDYGKTPSAPLALLGLASEKFSEGAISEAADLYARFVKKYPKHENAVQAAYNQINCIEAQGQYPEAAEAYAAFRAAHEKSRFAPQALLDRGRCLEKLERFAEAKQVYEDVVAFYPNSGWARLAQNNITILNSRM